MNTRTRPPHWRFEKDLTKLTLSRLTILALRAIPGSLRQRELQAEIAKRRAAGEQIHHFGK